MYYIGIDLAWGDKQPTGLAVLDDDARLLHVSAVRTDDEIEAALAPYVAGDCLAAIDAPLVVTQRRRVAPGRAAAQQGLPSLRRRHPPVQHRQARVRQRHPGRAGRPNGSGSTSTRSPVGVDGRSRSTRTRRRSCSSGWPKILRYKAKPGRDLDLLRSELLRLMSFVATVVPTDETWAGAAQPGRERHPQERAAAASRTRSTPWCAPMSPCSPTARRDRITTLRRPRDAAPSSPRLCADTGPARDAGPPPTRSRRAVRRTPTRRPELTRAGPEAITSCTGCSTKPGINYLSVTGRTKSLRLLRRESARTTRRAGSTPTR